MNNSFIPIKNKQVYSVYVNFMSSIVAATLGVAFLFRSVLINERLPGDAGDSRLTVTLLDHWYKVFTGEQTLRSTNFFWPDQNIMWRSESMFLQGIFYTPLKIFSGNSLLAAMGAHALTAFFGLIGIYYLSQKIRQGYFWGFYSTILISLSYVVNAKMMHLHLLTYLFLSWVVISLIDIAREPGKSANAIFKLACIMPILALSSWYVFVTSLMVLFLFMISFAAWNLSQFRKAAAGITKSVFKSLEDKLTQLFLFLLISFSLWGIWAYIYWPGIINRSSGWSFPEVLFYLPRIADLLNSTLGSYGIWITFFEFLNLSPSPTGERALGLTPVLFLSSIIVLLTLTKSIFTHTFMKSSNAIRLSFITAFTCFLSMILMISDERGQSLWWILFSYFPGASTLRAPFRMMVIISIALIFITIYWLFIFLRSPRKYLRLISIALLIVIPAEQVRQPIAAWNSGDFLPTNHRNLFESLENKLCDVFYLYDSTGSRNSGLVNGDAIALSTQYGLKTINGLTSFGSDKSIALANIKDESRREIKEIIEAWINNFEYDVSETETACISDYNGSISLINLVSLQRDESKD